MAQTAASVAFPLAVNPNNKHLVDKDGQPFLIKEISAWGLIQALPENEEAAFMDSVRSKGFNTLLVSLISYDTRFAGNPPSWQGIAPFTKQWDFSTYNDSYFAHADRVLKMAESKGMLVLLVPCYLGYSGDAKQGWWNELLDSNNSVNKSRAYGEYVGSRYKHFTNIIWVAGGDNNGVEPVYDHLNSIIQGIKKFDNHLWTGHFDAAPGTGWPSASKLYGKYIDIDGLYDFTEATIGDSVKQYQTELEHYNKGRMIFQLDQSYEHDIPHGPDNENYQWIRRKNYDGLLSGCAGTSFSPGEKDNQCYVFTNWQPLMNTTGMQQAQYCFNLFQSRPWYKLVPIPPSSNIIANRGDYGSRSFVCAALTTDSNTLMAYLPVGGAVNINLAAIKGGAINAWWYDVTTGKAIAINTMTNTKTFYQFTAPDNEDWVLVIDNAAVENLRVPGLMAGQKQSTVAGYIKAGGLNIYYETAGRGKPLVLVHAGFLNMRMWDALVPAFTPHYRVITIDMPGHGKTTGVDTILLVADAIRTVLDSLHIQKTAIAGVSMGAAATLDFVIRHPARVTKAILVSPGLNGWQKFIMLDSISVQCFNEIDKAADTKNDTVMAAMMVKYWFDGPFRTPADVDPAARKYIYDATRQNVALHNLNGLPNFATPRAADMLQTIQTPVLIMDGDKDVPLVMSTGKILNDNIKGSKRIIFPGAGHMINLEMPAEFAKTALQFLK